MESFHLIASLIQIQRYGFAPFVLLVKQPHFSFAQHQQRLFLSSEDQQGMRDQQGMEFFRNTNTGKKQKLLFSCYTIKFLFICFCFCFCFRLAYYSIFMVRWWRVSSPDISKSNGDSIIPVVFI